MKIKFYLINRNYIDYRKYNGKNKKELSNTTINGMLGCYGSFFKWLTAERIIEWNLCLILSKIKCIKSVKKSYSNIDLQKLKEACKTTGDIAFGHCAGVQKVHCHRFRHTLATNLSGKMPLTEIAAILGHNNISTTQDYCHTNPVSIVADYNRAMA